MEAPAANALYRDAFAANVMHQGVGLGTPVNGEDVYAHAGASEILREFGPSLRSDLRVWREVERDQEKVLLGHAPSLLGLESAER
jgi:cold shock CspA family protein